ncbi:MAG: elongation factor G [Christensenellaceae bacterium]|nr:elongation factor G [Christensenellaceae bacterium]
MKIYDAAHIKNIAIVGHGSEGKTTLTETMLFNAKAIDRRGRVEDGNTTTDYDPEETRRGISISSALAPFEWGGYKLNIIDVPGYFDFVGEQTQGYILGDSALILVNGFSGVAVGAEKAFKACKKSGKPMMIAVNQLDKEHADFAKVLEQMQEKFGSAVTPLQYPILKNNAFVGYVDVLDNKAFEFAKDGSTKECDIPGNIEAEVESIREAVIENAAANDEELMEKFFEGEELSKEDILGGLQIGIEAGDVVPVFCISALQNLGVKELTEALVAYMPAADKAIVPHAVADGTDNDVEIKLDVNAPFAAQVIKTIADPFVGKISVFKVYSGKLTADTALFNTNSQKAEKFSNITTMLGKKQIALTEIQAGDIGALAKLANTTTGDTLCAASNKVLFDSISFGDPCISLAVGAKKQGEEEKVFAGLHRLEEEDPTFRLTTEKETGEQLANGMGEMHLEVIMQKLKNKFGVEATLVDPKVPYRETIRKVASAEGRHKKQSGGAGQFGVVNIEFSPILDGSADFEFVNAIVGGVVPKEFIPAVEKGLRDCIQHGVLAGYPMVGIRAKLFDGKYHPVDSKEVAFRSAARLSYKAACANANPVMLEPICKAEVLIPDEFMGDIIGDLNKRRGRILGMNPVEDGQEVVAEVPMSEMTKYATDLRSMTQARGSFKLSFERYEEMPANLAQKVIASSKFVDEEE